MDQERKDYAEPTGHPLALKELAWGTGLLVGLPLVVAVMALCCGLGFVH
jgi:hypothetical protein